MYSENRARDSESNQIVSEDVEYITSPYIVTQIRAVDNFYNGTGGYANVVSGGLGEAHVTIRLSASALGRGFNFTIDVYCR